jgi:glycosyltransferase involved in cell wall biosynthesis
MGANRFRKVLSVSLDPRPGITRAMLQSLAQCRGIHDYLVLIAAEQGSEESTALAMSVDFAQTDIRIGPRTQNFSEKAFAAIDRGFAKAEFVIYLDGILALAPDSLEYLEYGAWKFQNDPDVFLISCEGPRCDSGANRDFETARRPARFVPPLGIWRNRWEWSKRACKAKGPLYGDALKNLIAKHKLKELYPLLSRCRRLDKGADPHREPQGGTFRESTPLVTAVMITGLHRERYAMARVAIECFRVQTWPSKNLLIVNHGEESLYTGDARIHELRFRKSKWHTVGDLRNLALEHASGDFIVNWDDDDWHHPRRMEVQMSARQPDAAILLKKRIHHSLVNGCSRYATYERGAEATILHPRNVAFRYPSLLRGSDSVFAGRFAERIAVENDPALHIRFYHGKNLWDADHIMAHLAAEDIQGKIEISEEHRELLSQVLPLYGQRVTV